MFKKIIAAVAVTLFLACSSNEGPANGGGDTPEPSGGKGPVSYYGKLKVRPGTPYFDGSKKGSEVQLRGISFGWSTTSFESSRFYETVSVERIVEDWKAEIVRAAYGTASAQFISNTAAENRGRIEKVVDAAIENDVYVIIDFHSHNAHNEVQQSKDFFGYMAEKYGSYDNVIFEIFNEPVCRASSATNCAASERINWAEIKSYAEEIIPVIRAHSSNLILVGTPQWSQRIQDVIGNKINDENVGYVLHFYAASHALASFRGNIENALNSGVPIFITEYGTVHSDGGQNNNYNTHNAGRTDEWHAFMDEKKISSAAWQISDKYEGSAFFGIQDAARKYDLNGDWADQSKMNESGKYIFNKLNGYSGYAPWRK
ncbi:MAG: glycoside hydrolase family 5 protein [Fibromonadaceae bacterium]|jgi:endoglucanase|nr:glycoside hydrolase family 5 protein [Fibromonadaceae bacterium]